VGEIVAAGTPEAGGEHPSSHTGRYLKEVLGQTPRRLLRGDGLTPASAAAPEREAIAGIQGLGVALAAHLEIIWTGLA